MWAALVLSLAASTEPVVLMPVEGADVLPAVRDAVDAVVREAAVRRLGPRLQSADDTDAVVADAVASGLNCSLREVSCGVRVGVIAGAGEVLVPTVRSGRDRRLELTVLRIDVARGSAVAMGATVLLVSDVAGLARFLGTLLEPPASVAVEVDGAVAGGVVFVDEVAVGALPLAAPVALSVGAHQVAVVDAAGTIVHQRALTTSAGFQRVAFAAPGSAVTPPASSASSSNAGASPLFMAGALTTGAGVVVGLGGGGLALFAETALATPRQGAEGYVEDRAFGQIMLGAAAVGVVVAGVGVTLMVLGGES
jgi:hypothetical protein